LAPFDVKARDHQDLALTSVNNRYTPSS
jgi:hypothetical protein